jgi:hypothetical protein
MHDSLRANGGPRAVPRYSAILEQGIQWRWSKVNMESRKPRDEQKISHRGLDRGDHESVRLASAVRRVLAAESISQRDLDQDPFLGEESVEQFIQGRKPKP